MRTATIEPATGRTLEAARQSAQALQPEYLVVPRSELRLDKGTGHLRVNGHDLVLTPLALSKLIRPTGLPPRYLLQSPNDVAAYNFNYWAPRMKGNVQLAVHEGRCIGAMKEGYRPISHARVIEQLDNWLCDTGSEGANQLHFREYILRNEDLRLRFTLPGVKPLEPRQGDIVEVGLDLVNIEAVRGYLDISGCYYRLICTNGMVDRRVSFARRARALDWQNHDAILEQAFGYFGEAAEQMVGYGHYLPAMTNVECPGYAFTEDEDSAEERRVWARGLLRLGRVPRRYVPDFLEALKAEEHTMYGAYNALSRLGRDSKEPALRLKWEKAAAQLLTPFCATTYGYEPSRN